MRGLYPKSFVLNRVVRVLKDVVIPELQSEKAREQAIAMISVLKNLDSRTSENDEMRARENAEVGRFLAEIARDIQVDPRFARTSLGRWAEQLPPDVDREQEEAATDVLARRNHLNQLLCDLIRLLHADQGTGDGLEAAREELLRRVRKVLRGQLDRQMEQIH